MMLSFGGTISVMVIKGEGVHGRDVCSLLHGAEFYNPKGLFLPVALEQVGPIFLVLKIHCDPPPRRWGMQA